ncbi:MAG: histidine phosphatase family protein [Bacteroidota bacterium]
MTYPKKVYIIRHGETELNRQRIIQGSGVDASLNDTGRKQAQAFFEHYQSINFDVVITSKLTRTRETMAPFIETGLKWEQYAEINEMAWGIYEGQPGTPAMRQDYKDMLAAWKREEYDVRLEGGESALELSNRIKIFVEALKSREESTILICSHGRAMRCLICTLKEEPLYNMELYQHSNTGLWIANYDGEQFTLEVENDTQHLEGVEIVH